MLKWKTVEFFLTHTIAHNSECLYMCRINCIHARLIGTREDVFGCNYGMMMERPYCLSSHHVSIRALANSHICRTTRLVKQLIHCIYLLIFNFLCELRLSCWDRSSYRQKCSISYWPVTFVGSSRMRATLTGRVCASLYCSFTPLSPTGHVA